MRLGASSETPTTFAPNIGASLCHPIGAPGGYLETSACTSSAGSSSASSAQRSRSHSSDAGSGSLSSSLP